MLLSKKNVWKSDKRWEPVKFSRFSKLSSLLLGTCWTTFVFMSRLKSRYFNVKIAMLFWDIHHTLPCEFANHRAGSQLIILLPVLYDIYFPTRQEPLLLFTFHRLCCQNKLSEVLLSLRRCFQLTVWRKVPCNSIDSIFLFCFFKRTKDNALHRATFPPKRYNNKTWAENTI